MFIILVKVISEAKSSVEVFEISPDFRFVWRAWCRAKGRPFFRADSWSNVRVIYDRLINVWPIKVSIDLPLGYIPGEPIWLVL